MEDTPQTESVLVPASLEAGCKALILGANRVIAHAHLNLPAEHWARIRQSVDDGMAAFTVQVDIPSATVSVFVDGQGWAAPQCLLRLEPPEKVEVKLDA